MLLQLGQRLFGFRREFLIFIEGQSASQRLLGLFVLNMELSHAEVIKEIRILRRTAAEAFFKQSNGFFMVTAAVMNFAEDLGDFGIFWR